MKQNRTYNDEIKNIIIREYIDGQSINRLAIKYNICYGTIKNWLKKKHIQSNNTNDIFRNIL